MDVPQNIPIANDKLYAAGEAITQRQRSMHTPKTGTLGICWNCVALICAESKFGHVYAHCDALERRLSINDPILKCTAHTDRYALPLHVMVDIATHIDPANIKQQAGFIYPTK